ncbi:MAG: permease [Candidatus Zixiibacteriota bacterium]
MLEHLINIMEFMGRAYLHVWPYLLATVPLAVIVRLSGGARHISKIFQGRPIVSIMAATVVGAVSPFCSCGVIPIIASLLIGGVPLAPVMTFWIASPSMDPEIFFLSVSMVGWELAIWRLAATFLLSMGAGLLTLYLERHGKLSGQILLNQSGGGTVGLLGHLRQAGASIKNRLRIGLAAYDACSAPARMQRLGCGIAALAKPVPISTENFIAIKSSLSKTATISLPVMPKTSCGCTSDDAKEAKTHKTDLYKRILKETTGATVMVFKFMGLAFLIEALITLYVPSAWIESLLGQSNHWAIPASAFLGVPAYTSNLTALPMISGLLNQGMSHGAALAFLIAGPTTTLPAMAAVYGLVKQRVFILYLSISLIGSLIFGYLYNVVHLLI